MSWYNQEHRHTGLKGFTPAEVYHGRHHALAQERQRVLEAAHAKNPERWINGPPRVPMPPAVVAINPVPPETIEATPALANEIVPAERPIIVSSVKEGIPT